ncbi:GNAT family N-acetyltransferase [Aurantiacibacter sp. D1-12]|uniref:GNAT family N-acetyltransferase n=1 Tax=Aurantiacibacter sp. D1-12 TaxID=2993658 RepID=UPI00237C9F86|nr:GNAT family N-acetyltransferase [Aurantiacibacter sp. D1-12]MDE1466173.1 GNAT family N-acetyltransferase [Aurantiacibacter sp. D1-12]
MAEDLASIAIHRVNRGDDHLFRSILPEVFDHLVEPDKLDAHLASHTHFLAVAMDGDTMVAMVMANLHLHPDKPNELYIDELGTNPDYRNRGIGTRLMKEAVTWGREHGCTSCWLGTETDNVEAQAVYRKWQPNPEEILMFEFDL